MKLWIGIKRQSVLAFMLMILFNVGGCDKIHHWFHADKPSQAAEEKVKDQSDRHAVMVLPDFTRLVEQQGSTVVNIQVSRTNPAGSGEDNSGADHALSENDPFYEYFKRLLPAIPQTPQVEDDEYNFGSGFIISKNGYILTNAHVVNGLNNIKVLLNDKREFQAKLIGTDLQTDIALIKIDADHLPVVQLGNPKDLRVGEWVAAIGAPFGFDNSVTSGIVSAKGRSLPDENYTPFIQTDVAINPGNSGGPLFNLDGQVVGINSQIYSRDGGFMGISFAIPIDVAMSVAKQLITNGKVQRGRLGVVIQEVSYDLAKSFGLGRASGALISQVVAGGPADKAGIQIGDIVQSVNGEEISNSSDLPVMVGLLLPGKQIVLGIWRQGQAQTIYAVLDDTVDISHSAEMVANAHNEHVPLPEAGISTFNVEGLGLVLQAMKNGIIVVEASGLAARTGMRRGDIILAVGSTRVHNEADLNQVLGAIGKNVPLLVRRGNSTLFLALIEH